jgi:hypothetical protein
MSDDATPDPTPPDPWARLKEAIRPFTVDHTGPDGEPLPNGSDETALDELCLHPYMLTAPDDVARLFGQAMLNQAKECQELREAAETCFGGDFRS